MDIAGEKGKYDWNALKIEYVTGRISVERMSKKYNIPLPTIKQRATKDKWSAAKKRHYDSVVRKTSEKLASRQANKLAKELSIADKMADVLKAALDDAEQFRRHIVQTRNGEIWDASERVFDKYDMKAFKDAVSALKTIEELKRSIDGILTVQEKERMEVERRRLALEEQKAGAGGGDDADTGVIMLAPVLSEDEDDADDK